VTGWEDVIEELPTPVRAELLPVESATAEERATLVEQDLGPTERPLYELLSLDESRHVDELVEQSGLTSFVWFIGVSAKMLLFAHRSPPLSAAAGIS